MKRIISTKTAAVRGAARSLFGACLGFAVACGDYSEDFSEQGDDVLTTSLPISGGNLLTAGEHGPPDTSVVKLRLTSPIQSQICSGTKIGPRLFLTAGHCVEGVQVGSTVLITNELSGALASGVLGLGVGAHTRTITSVRMHPSYEFRYIFAVGYDVALLTVDGTTDAIPSYQGFHDDWVGPNQRATITAYGCDAISPSHGGRKQWAYFDLVDQATLRDDTGYTSAVAADIYAHAMVSVGIPEACPGDSGSPLFQKFGSTWKIVGVTSHGGNGHSRFQRYSNVRGWLASPATNLIGVGAQGFLLNVYSGRCMTGGVTLSSSNGVITTNNGVRQANCDGRNQSLDKQSWQLMTSGTAADVFFIKNGSNGRCLDLESTAEGARVVHVACHPTSQFTSTQRWRFTPSYSSNFRQLRNLQTDFCVTPEGLGEGHEV